MTTSMMKRLSLLVLPLAFNASSDVRADNLLRDWNVVVTGNAYLTQHTEGPVRIGGNLNVNGYFNVQPRAGTTVGSGGVGLMVGGTVLNAGFKSVQVNSGANALIGGPVQADRFEMNGGTLTPNSSVARDAVVGDAALLQGYSQGFKALATNSQFIQGSNSALFKVLNQDIHGNAVFNVDGAALFGNSSVANFDIDLNGKTFKEGQSIVINVSGTDINFAGSKNFNGVFGSPVNANVIWNFYEAQTINLNGASFRGSILAYQGALLNTGTIDGSVFVAKLGTSLNPFNGQNSEIHPPSGSLLYEGYIPTSTAVPEPSSLAMAGLAIAAGAALARRRRGIA